LFDADVLDFPAILIGGVFLRKGREGREQQGAATIR
jgi:hypothetical protein